VISMGVSSLKNAKNIQKALILGIVIQIKR